MKKTLSVLLAFCLAFALLPFGARADHSGACGEHVHRLLDDAGTLTISGTGLMENYEQLILSGGVVASTAPWSDLRQSIRRVVVSEGVTSVGDRAFYGFSALETVCLRSRCVPSETALFPAAHCALLCFRRRWTPLETVRFPDASLWKQSRCRRG